MQLKSDIAINSDIIMKPVNEIIPYWRNPRRNDKTVDALCEVIPVSGFNVPIVIDKNGVVVKGHARLKAAKRLGMEKVPCIVTDASEDVIKADRIADNKIQELSSWDFAKRDVELERIGGKMRFERLFFDAAETPTFDATEMPAVDFTPVGIETPSEDAQAPFVHEHELVHEHTMQAEMPSTGETEAASVPAKRVLKTLCPYCGKVVVLNV